MAELPVREMRAGPVHGAGIDAVLAERGARYGEFDEHARIAQNIKDVLRGSPNWDRLNPSMREALEMIAHKLARIVNGDPNYDDSWRDVGGYARLVERQLLGDGL